ncbi:hypothetical protein KKF61_00390 [Patescibacteria group bacterium]|nr:hypothetical protein [Patescibacteria group bacterium]MBU0964196.1 hypothetical protein [Patescibacteria group bacterium]
MVIIASIALTAGVVKAAGMTADWLKVGTQGEGGVTFFNGTIINETTGDNDADNPVTFGDNVRIDGRVYRGATAGTADTLPFIVNDNMQVTGTLTVAGLSGDGVVNTANIADGAITAAKLADGAITTADLADDSVTADKIVESTITTTEIYNETIITQDLAGGSVTASAENYGTATQTTTENPPDYDTLDGSVTMATDDSTLFCMFSGVFGNNMIGGHARAVLVVDGSPITHTIRRGTSAGADDIFTLATSALVDVDAGEHVVTVGFNTADAGSQVSVYNNTLDCIELKK